jgi:hypothetical protein
MATKKLFNDKAYGNIKGGVTAGATSIELYPGQMVAFAINLEITGEMYLTITDAESEIEIVKVTAVSGDTFTVVRGQESITAKAWPAGAVISQRVTAGVAGVFIQREAFRTIAYNPNELLAGDYVGEKIYQSGQKLWWKNRSGTDWQLIAGDEQGWIVHDPPATIVLFGKPVRSPSLGIWTAFCMDDVGYYWVAISTTGRVWELHDTAPWQDGWMTGLCWSEELEIFVAVNGDSVAAKLIATSTDGINWTLRTHPAGDTYWSCVCWAPEIGKFCAMADDPAPAGRAMVSSNGIDWTAYDTAVAQGVTGALCWSPTLSLFCAGTVDAAGLASHIMTSPDGQTWTDQIPLGEALHWNSMCWSEEKHLFVAVGMIDAFHCVIKNSYNGNAWTSRAVPDDDQNLVDVEWSPELELFVALAYVNDAGADHVFTSENGDDWIQMVSPEQTGSGYSSLGYSSDLGLFCIAGPAGVATSDDGGIAL